MLALFVLVMGGIYMGFFTPSEAAAVGAFGAVVISLAIRRFTTRIFVDSLSETGRTTAMIFILIIGAMIFMRFLAISTLPFVLSGVVADLNVPPYAIIAIVVLFYIIVGCFLDIFSSLVLTIPIIYPTIIALGFDPVWFGVIFVRVAEIGLITPPIGLNCFVIAGVTELPLGTVFRGIIPFFIADILHVTLLIAVPQLSLFLPRLLVQ